jgi:hypothetical protein
MPWYGASSLFKRTTVVTTAATALSGASPFDLTTVAVLTGEPWFQQTLNPIWLQRVLTACSISIANYCNRIFAQQTYTDTFFPQRDPPISVTIGGVDPLQLAYFPMTSGSSVVTENGVALVLGTDYLEDPELGQLTRLDVNGWPMRWPKLGLVVQYQAGYTMAAIPPDLADAAIEFVKWRYYSATRDPSLKSQEIPGDISQSFLYGTGPGGPDDIPAVVSGKIDRYRIYPIVA